MLSQSNSFMGQAGFDMSPELLTAALYASPYEVGEDPSGVVPPEEVAADLIDYSAELVGGMDALKALSVDLAQAVQTSARLEWSRSWSAGMC